MWGYVLAAAALIVSVAVAISTGSSAWGLFAGFVWGAIFGRIAFHYRRKLKLVAVLMVAGAVVGLWVGALFGYAGWMTLAFIVGCITSYVAHKKGLIESVEF